MYRKNNLLKIDIPEVPNKIKKIFFNIKPDDKSSYNKMKIITNKSTKK